MQLTDEERRQLLIQMEIDLHNADCSMDHPPTRRRSKLLAVSIAHGCKYRAQANLALSTVEQFMADREEPPRPTGLTLLHSPQVTGRARHIANRGRALVRRITD